MTLFFANFGREPRLAIDFKGYLPTEATVVAEDMHHLYQQLQSNMRFLNKRMAH